MGFLAKGITLLTACKDLRGSIQVGFDCNVKGMIPVCPYLVPDTCTTSHWLYRILTIKSVVIYNNNTNNNIVLVVRSFMSVTTEFHVGIPLDDICGRNVDVSNVNSWIRQRPCYIPNGFGISYDIWSAYLLIFKHFDSCSQTSI